MELYEAMEKRHSVRDYEDRPVEKAKLERVLNAARIAPSASNKQDLRFVVVQDAGLRNTMAEQSGQKLFAKAPVVIAAVSTDPREMRCGVKAGTVDCAIAIDPHDTGCCGRGPGHLLDRQFRPEDMLRPARHFGTRQDRGVHGSGPSGRFAQAQDAEAARRSRLLRAVFLRSG